MTSLQDVSAKQLCEDDFIAAIAAAIDQPTADAAKILQKFLEDCGIAYGESGCDWDREAANEIAVAYFLDP